MADVLTPRERSACMRAVRSRDTSPELRVRRLAHALGARYVLDGAGLAGRPDLVFPRRRKAIFVHGCFWHFHQCKRGRRKPATNADYWTKKRGRNKVRDKWALATLTQEGWDVLVVWECQTRDAEALTRRLRDFLGS
jgi:DNA mismatch endonuclease (patch repair protein)